METKARDYPQWFSLTKDGNRWHWINRPLGIDQKFTFLDESTLPYGPMEYISRQTQGDFTLQDEREGTLWVDAGMVTTQADWSLDFNIGMNFHEWHAPVPLAHEKGIFDRALKFLLKLQHGAPVRRYNWTMTANPLLDTAPETYPEWGYMRTQLNQENMGRMLCQHFTSNSPGEALIAFDRGYAGQQFFGQLFMHEQLSFLMVAGEGLKGASGAIAEEHTTGLLPGAVPANEGWAAHLAVLNSQTDDHARDALVVYLCSRYLTGQENLSPAQKLVAALRYATANEETQAAELAFREALPPHATVETIKKALDNGGRKMNVNMLRAVCTLNRLPVAQGRGHLVDNVAHFFHSGVRPTGVAISVDPNYAPQIKCVSKSVRVAGSDGGALLQKLFCFAFTEYNGVQAANCTHMYYNDICTHTAAKEIVVDRVPLSHLRDIVQGKSFSTPLLAALSARICAELTRLGICVKTLLQRTLGWFIHRRFVVSATLGAQLYAEARRDMERTEAELLEAAWPIIFRYV
jgi:hypothetical protein